MHSIGGLVTYIQACALYGVRYSTVLLYVPYFINNGVLSILVERNYGSLLYGVWYGTNLYSTRQKVSVHKCNTSA